MTTTDETTSAEEQLDARLVAAGRQPRGRMVARPDDMSPDGNLRILWAPDGDLQLTVFDGRKSATVEFCAAAGGGGGRSWRTREALLALMAAMEADNNAAGADASGQLGSS